MLNKIILPLSTKELALLNDIHDKFNKKQLSPAEARHIIYRQRWKYHYEKIDFLIGFTYAVEITDKKTLDEKLSKNQERTLRQWCVNFLTRYSLAKEKREWDKDMSDFTIKLLDKIKKEKRKSYKKGNINKLK
ncbi:MAG: hypothetical protein ACOCQR_03305 [bacterium]